MRTWKNCSQTYWNQRKCSWGCLYPVDEAQIISGLKLFKIMVLSACCSKTLSFIAQVNWSYFFHWGSSLGCFLTSPIAKLFLLVFRVFLTVNVYPYELSWWSKINAHGIKLGPLPPWELVCSFPHVCFCGKITINCSSDNLYYKIPSHSWFQLAATRMDLRPHCPLFFHSICHMWGA